MTFEIIIPFYNESCCLEETIVSLKKEIIQTSSLFSNIPIKFWWIDDGSTDGSVAVLQKAINLNFTNDAKLSLVSHRVMRREKNQGKGSAICYAIEAMKKEVPLDSVVALWDSDGELDSQSLFAGLNLVRAQKADIVFGSRFSNSNIQALNYRHYLGNKVLTTFSNWFSNLSLSDVHCCARMLRAELLFQLPLKSRGFDFEAEFVGLVGRIRSPKLQIVELPILYKPRTVNAGKKIRMKHVLPQIYQALRCSYFTKDIELDESRSHVFLASE